MKIEKINIPLCADCKHYNKFDYEKLSCKAYPKGIPEKIIEGEVDHKKPYKGDNGIQFEKK